MASILCIETATTNCSVALSVNGSVAVLIEDNSKQFSHAERLHTFIEEVLVEAIKFAHEACAALCDLQLELREAVLPRHVLDAELELLPTSNSLGGGEYLKW